MPATNTFNPLSEDVTQAGIHAFAITPDDAADVAFVTRGLYVGASGNVKVTMFGGESVTFVGLAAGVIHPLRVNRVWSTGTTATGIIGVY